MKKIIVTLIYVVQFVVCSTAQTFNNPILSGFNPDPSVCRVGDDYYLATSSFCWYPGLPVYHSKDLVHWELISHAIDRPDMLPIGDGQTDNDGTWAVTIRYHDGIFYLISTGNKCGGNFYVKSADPRGPWSDPVFLPDADGIDPSLFFDTDGRCYYTGNTWSFKKQWPGQCGIWMQEIDLSNGKFIGERKIISYGHAANATYGEGPHIYHVGDRYLLLMAEGGSSENHAVTAHTSKSLWGPYMPCTINPVLTHRHFGYDYHISSLGHADLVQTQNGDWYAVCLGKRMIDGHNPLARETFLCPVRFEKNGQPVFNPGIGGVRLREPFPKLPVFKNVEAAESDEFDADNLDMRWHTIRTPKNKFYEIKAGILKLKLMPSVCDSLTHSAILVERTTSFVWQAETRMRFSTNKDHEQAGMILHRSAKSYYSLMKGKKSLNLYKVDRGQKTLIAGILYQKPEVFLRVEADSLNVRFAYSSDGKDWACIGSTESMIPLCDNSINKFNGVGIGMYATSNGKPSNKYADYEYFTLHNLTK